MKPSIHGINKGYVPFKIRSIVATSICCFSILYANSSFAVWPVTEEVLTGFVE